MAARFVSVWFRHLTTDWFSLRAPYLRDVPLVLRTSVHGRMVITAANAVAQGQGIDRGMVLADARAVIPHIEVRDDPPDLVVRLLQRLAEWCIRFTPVVAVDLPDGLMLDASGCAYLWGGEDAYVTAICHKLHARGYDVRVAMADTVGVAWAMARHGTDPMVVEAGRHIDVLLSLPPEALRLEADVLARLHKLGLRQIRQFMKMPRASLRRRFGPHFMMRLDQAVGQQVELLAPVVPLEPYQERLPCMDPIVTATGIEIALQQLLEILCRRLQQEQKGLRVAVFKGYRVDGKIEQIRIGTTRATRHVDHLFKLFGLHLSSMEPALGIELFVLEALQVEDISPRQENMWAGAGGLGDVRLAELLDRLAGKVGMEAIRRYVPDEHYWPERSFKPATSLQEEPTTSWRADKLRPMQILKEPQPIEVMVLMPDYPPMLFIYQGKRHTIVKADGPERIEQEWWLQQGQHRDYYQVEDGDGGRYWVFRLGHYHEKIYQWFIHGFFA